MNISNFAVNQELELNGKWFQIGQGAEVLVARHRNSRYRKEFRKAMSKYPESVVFDTISEDESSEIICSITAKTILLDWKNIDDEDGTPLTYSYENAKRLLAEYPEFFTLISNLSKNVKNYQDQRTIEASNSVKKS